MQLSAYLSTSRHGISCFRWPIPASLHPSGLRADIKFSLGTREPCIAKRMSPVLVLAGQSALAKAQATAMRYGDIRTHVQNHFRTLLKDFKSGVSATGPLDEWRRDALTGSRDRAGDDPEGFLSAPVYPDGVDGLLGRFCAAAGVIETLTTSEQELLKQEIMQAYRACTMAAAEHEASHDVVDLSELPAATLPTGPPGQPWSVGAES